MLQCLWQAPWLVKCHRARVQSTPIFCVTMVACFLLQKFEPAWHKRGEHIQFRKASSMLDTMALHSGHLKWDFASQQWQPKFTNLQSPWHSKNIGPIHSNCQEKDSRIPLLNCLLSCPLYGLWRCWTLGWFSRLFSLAIAMIRASSHGNPLSTLGGSWTAYLLSWMNWG